MILELPDPVFRRFHDLMPHRIREVLLVSSPYEAFIMEQEGNLTERIFDEYSELSLSAAPRVTHVTSAEAAFEVMEDRRFDLVMVMKRLADMDPAEFARTLKKKRPGRPVVLLAFDDPELERTPQYIDRNSIDMVFMWSGEPNLLLAVIKYIEDQQNVDHDIKRANVRVLIVVEDSLRYYSSFLGTLYSELMQQSSSLYAEGVNRLHKLLHMRSRPKILLAREYQEALDLFHKYRHNVMAVISDVGFNRGGKRDRTAGIELALAMRKECPELTLLLNSAESDMRCEAEKIGAFFLDKNSPSLHRDIRAFLVENLGFGPFVFRMPDGREVGRAHDVREMERVLGDIPAESLKYHAMANHISVWLTARSEFDLARLLRPKKVSEFENMESVREYLLAAMKNARKKRRWGVIAEYKRKRLEPENLFLKIGDGSIGGKARGIAFVNSIIEPEKWQDKYEGMTVQVPQTLVLATDWFDRFLNENNLSDFVYNDADDATVIETFLKGRLPTELREELRFILDSFHFPLAVRSSSLLEDSHFQPFAGIYETYMLPNIHEDLNVRLREMARAIKLVYASVYKANAKAYIKSTARRIEEEKMAIVIQGVVGQGNNGRYYPTFSGVAQSYNYYPIGPQRSEDGIVMVALGLGRMVVDGGQALRFSPAHPQVLPQYSSPAAVLENSQRGFWAIDMTKPFEDGAYNSQTTMGYFGLDSSEKDGTLKAVGSVYHASDDQIRDGLDQAGPRVITFNNFLKYKTIPLTPALEELIEICRYGMGCEVEIEFACDMGDWGKRAGRGKPRQEPTLSVLQLRPIVTEYAFENHQTREISNEDCICKTDMALGHGVFETVYDVVYVRRDRFDPSKTVAIADEIGKVNKEMSAMNRPYVLIGPGRWGSADPWLGIPVQWAQISNAKVMVEASPSGYNVDPSQGTHFFQNITSLRVGYFTIPPGAEMDKDESFVDWDFLDGTPCEICTDYLRHIHMDSPFFIHIDGRKGAGVISKPGAVLEPNNKGVEKG